MRIRCPKCGANLNVPETMIGKKGRCPRCGHVLTISSIPKDVQGKSSVSKNKPPESIIVHKETKVESTSGASNTCGWCKKEIPAGATHCPNCGKLRKDIYRDKLKCITFIVWFAALSMALFCVFIIGMKKYWWESPGSTIWWATEFHLPTFLSSPLVILLIIGIISTAIGSIVMAVRVRKKLNHR